MTRQGRKTGLQPVVPGTQRRSTNPPHRIPFTRVSSVLPFIHVLDEIGSPVERFARQANLNLDSLFDPDALVPLRFAHRFAELAAYSEGIEHLGVLVGQRVSAFGLGSLGQQLQQALTVYEYVHMAIRLIGSHTSGGRFWITRAGDHHIRLNQFSPGRESAGRCHADIYTLVMTINMLRNFSHGQWRPGQISLMAGDERHFRDVDAVTDAQIITGQPHTSLTLPVSLLQQPLAIKLPLEGNPSNNQHISHESLPEDFIGSLESLIATLLNSGSTAIHVVAEAAGMSERTLQRRLSESGQNYSAILGRVRTRVAAERLAGSDMPVSEIAASLGYRDASNFTRAFRSQTGMSPSHYRERSCG